MNVKDRQKDTQGPKSGWRKEVPNSAPRLSQLPGQCTVPYTEIENSTIQGKIDEMI